LKWHFIVQLLHHLTCDTNDTRYGIMILLLCIFAVVIAAYYSADSLTRDAMTVTKEYNSRRSTLWNDSYQADLNGEAVDVTEQRKISIEEPQQHNAAQSHNQHQHHNDTDDDNERHHMVIT
jgi:hypothetical protein